MSIYTGRAETAILPSRLELALRSADGFTEDDLDLLRDQLRITWRLQRRKFVDIVRYDIFYRQKLIELLSDDSALLADIERHL